MNGAPMITVVTPVRNGMPFIRECVASVAAQQAPHEHVVCDGGSTDGTLEYLRSVDGIRLVEGPDAGQSDALIKGFARAQGEILGWVNADDRLCAGALERIALAAARHPAAAAVSGDGSEIDESGAVTHGIQGMPMDASSILFRDTMLQPSTWFRRAAYEAVGGLDTRLSYCMDSEFWRRLLMHGPFARVAENWSDFRMHQASKTLRSPSAFVAEWRAVLERAGMPATAQLYDVERCGSEGVACASLDSAALRRQLETETGPGTAAWISGLVSLRAGRADAAMREFRLARGCATPAVRLQALRESASLVSRRRDPVELSAIVRETAAVLADMPFVENPEREAVWSRYALASLQETLGQTDLAEANFRSVIDCEPTDRVRYVAGSWFHLGRLYSQKKRPVEARHAFENCLAIVPRHAAAAAALGELG